jgi:hypothetical protein
MLDESMIDYDYLVLFLMTYIGHLYVNMLYRSNTSLYGGHETEDPGS